MRLGSVTLGEAYASENRSREKIREISTTSRTPYVHGVVQPFAEPHLRPILAPTRRTHRYLRALSYVSGRCDLSETRSEL